MKSWFFERLNKSDKPLTGLTREQRETHINKITNEKELSTDTTDTQKSPREYMPNYICQKIQQPKRNGQVSRNIQPLKTETRNIICTEPSLDVK